MTTPSAGRAFGLLTGEALRDAVRRRIVPVIAVVSLLSLFGVDTCTSCGSTATVVSDGERVPLADVAGWSGLVLYSALALWTAVLAGILAADHLSETLDDGSANLILARPVSRSVFVLARLAGALAVALATGVVLLSATTVLLHVRGDLAFAPALAAGAACALGALTVAALAMVSSLLLPRIATALLVLASVAAVAWVNGLSLAGAGLGGALGVLDRFGPPLLSAVVLGLAPWIAPAELSTLAPYTVLRLLLWAGAALALLVGVFGRVEIGR